jgi:hypothetical protein
LSAVCSAHRRGNGALNRPSRNLSMSRSQARQLAMAVWPIQSHQHVPQPPRVPQPPSVPLPPPMSQPPRAPSLEGPQPRATRLHGMSLEGMQPRPRPHAPPGRGFSLEGPLPIDPKHRARTPARFNHLET